MRRLLICSTIAAMFFTISPSGARAPKSGTINRLVPVADCQQDPVEGYRQVREADFRQVRAVDFRLVPVAGCQQDPVEGYRQVREADFRQVREAACQQDPAEGYRQVREADDQRVLAGAFRPGQPVN
jgi:hypothetical protein